MPADQDIEEFLTHIGRLPDVFRANVSSRNGEFLWSSDAELIGQSFPDDGELAGAMCGEVHPKLNIVDRDAKDDHVGFPTGITEFIEYYIPVRSRDGASVVGAVEVYKSPGASLVSIRQASIYAWLCALAASAVLFDGLVGPVHRILHGTTRIFRQLCRRKP